MRDFFAIGLAFAGLALSLKRIPQKRIDAHQCTF
jgi:hypothetical protein